MSLTVVWVCRHIQSHVSKTLCLVTLDEVVGSTTYIHRWHTTPTKASLLEPFEKIKIVTVRIPKAHHPRAPTLILRLIIEGDTFGLGVRINAVNILYLETYMVDSRRVLKQCEIAAYCRRVRFSGLEDEQLGCTGHHGDATIVLVCPGKTKPLIKRDRPFEVGHANSDIIDSLDHICRL